ncbi:MAG: hypothetical protein IIC64_14915, partial [SAR324 cluster bacterium]|nr:hypothetical protein [SAR324 cluster bacterium]
MMRFLAKRGTGGLVAAVVLWGALAACSPTEGDDGLFDPVETTNDDYDAAVFVDVGNNPITMDAADYDNTNGLDIVVVNLLDDANAFNGSISLLTNDGSANFTETRIDIAPFATIVKFLELDSGNWDIAVLVNDEDDPHVWICTDPSGGCPSPLTRPLPGIAAQMKRVNIDGGAIENDLLLTIPSTGQIVAILSDGAGVYTQVETDVSGKPTKFTTGEFNADVNLYLDVAILRPSNNDAIVLAGDGLGGFPTTIATVTLLSNLVAITAMNLDGDSTNESFAVASDTANEVRVQANDVSGTGSFTAVITKVDENPGFLLAGDFDGEGSDDLILMHGKSNFVGYLKGTGSLPTPGYTKSEVTV